MGAAVIDALEAANELSAKTQYDLTVDTAVDDTDYEFQFDFVSEALFVVVDSGSGATTGSIADAIAAKIAADEAEISVPLVGRIQVSGFLSGLVDAVSDSIDTVTITGASAGLDFDLSESDPNLSLSAKTTVSDATVVADAEDVWETIAEGVVGKVVSDTISADQDDYDAGGDADWEEMTYLRIDGGGANRTITGLRRNDSGAGIDPLFRSVLLANVGSAANIILADEDTNSAAENRFNFVGGSDLTVNQNQVVHLLYDPTLQRWLQVG